MPPISVYRVGDMHFVRDGHHRVSVARALGLRVIDAGRDRGPHPPAGAGHPVSERSGVQGLRAAVSRTGPLAGGCPGDPLHA